MFKKKLAPAWSSASIVKREIIVGSLTQKIMGRDERKFIRDKDLNFMA